MTRGVGSLIYKQREPVALLPVESRGDALLPRSFGHFPLLIALLRTVSGKGLTKQDLA